MQSEALGKCAQQLLNNAGRSRINRVIWRKKERDRLERTSGNPLANCLFDSELHFEAI